MTYFLQCCIIKIDKIIDISEDLQNSKKLSKFYGKRLYQNDSNLYIKWSLIMNTGKKLLEHNFELPNSLK